MSCAEISRNAHDQHGGNLHAMADRRVLVVDDEPMMREALEASLKRRGWKVETAAGAVEAMAKFDATHVPLVITDIRMPDGDGLEVLEHVHSASPETAVILLTAYGSVPDAVEAMRHGACDYLVKPISFDRLQMAVTQIMARERGPQTIPASGELDMNVDTIASSDNAPGPSSAPVESRSLRELERRLLIATLEATGGNRTRAAEMLGISLRTVRNKIHAYGLPRRESRREPAREPRSKPSIESSRKDAGQ
jgi:DNA-binding NtrC family response regulator